MIERSADSFSPFGRRRRPARKPQAAVFGAGSASGLRPASGAYRRTSRVVDADGLSWKMGAVKSCTVPRHLAPTAPSPGLATNSAVSLQFVSSQSSGSTAASAAPEPVRKSQRATGLARSGRLVPRRRGCRLTHDGRPAAAPRSGVPERFEQFPVSQVGVRDAEGRLVADLHAGRCTVGHRHAAGLLLLRRSTLANASMVNSQPCVTRRCRSSCSRGLARERATGLLNLNARVSGAGACGRVE